MMILGRLQEFIFFPIKEYNLIYFHPFYCFCFLLYLCNQVYFFSFPFLYTKCKLLEMPLCPISSMLHAGPFCSSLSHFQGPQEAKEADFHMPVLRFCCIQTFTNVTFGNMCLLAACSPWRSYYKCH